MQRERRPATHILRVEVPLDLSEEQMNGDAQRVFADTLAVILAHSRAAWRGALADDPHVTVTEV